MNNNQVQIGKANYDKNSGGFGGGFGWFYIEDNKPNIYRVLPPLKSLAQYGKTAKYYRIHRGLRGSDGKQKPFQCIEESDYKTKIISVHCPLCDRVRELEANLEQAKAAGATKEQQQEMRNKMIFPLQNEGKYYLNVVNQEGKMGVLSIGSKHHQAYTALAKEMEQKGFDVTGMQGIFLNFKKTTQYKGDKNAVLQVEPFLALQSDQSYRFVTHELTQEVINRLDKETADLGNLFKTLSPEQIATILSYEGEARAKYMDMLFEAPEKVQAQETQGSVPGTNAQLVSNVTSTQSGFQVNTPQLPPQQPVTPNQNMGTFNGTQQMAPQQQVQQQVQQVQQQQVVQQQVMTPPVNTQMQPMGGMIMTPPPQQLQPQQQAVTMAPPVAPPPMNLNPSAPVTNIGAMSDADFMNMMQKK